MHFILLATTQNIAGKDRDKNRLRWTWWNACRQCYGLKHIQSEPLRRNSWGGIRGQQWADGSRVKGVAWRLVWGQQQGVHCSTKLIWLILYLSTDKRHSRVLNQTSDEGGGWSEQGVAPDGTAGVSVTPAGSSLAGVSLADFPVFFHICNCDICHEIQRTNTNTKGWK